MKGFIAALKTLRHPKSEFFSKLGSPNRNAGTLDAALKRPLFHVTAHVPELRPSNCEPEATRGLVPGSNLPGGGLLFARIPDTQVVCEFHVSSAVGRSAGGSAGCGRS